MMMYVLRYATGCNLYLLGIHCQHHYRAYHTSGIWLHLMMLIECVSTETLGLNNIFTHLESSEYVINCENLKLLTSFKKQEENGRDRRVH